MRVVYEAENYADHIALDLVTWMRERPEQTTTFVICQDDRLRIQLGAALSSLGIWNPLQSSAVDRRWRMPSGAEVWVRGIGSASELRDHQPDRLVAIYGAGGRNAVEAAARELGSNVELVWMPINGRKWRPVSPRRISA